MEFEILFADLAHVFLRFIRDERNQSCIFRAVKFLSYWFLSCSIDPYEFSVPRVFQSTSCNLGIGFLYFSLVPLFVQTGLDTTVGEL